MATITVKSIKAKQSKEERNGSGFRDGRIILVVAIKQSFNVKLYCYFCYGIHIRVFSQATVLVLPGRSIRFFVFLADDVMYDDFNYWTVVRLNHGYLDSASGDER